MNTILRRIVGPKIEKKCRGEKYEKELFGIVKCRNEEYQECLRCQLDRTLSKKDQDTSSVRTKYFLSKLIEKVNCKTDIECLCVGCRNIYEIRAFHFNCSKHSTSGKIKET